MAMNAFCTTCKRTVYIEADRTPVCPVCSSPPLETVPAPSEDEPAPSEDEPAQG